MTKQELVKAVKDYAIEHYNDGGWDVVVECWSDAEIAEQIGGASTVKGAIKKFSWLVDVWADQEADAINSAF